ncbi:MAG: TrmH family RNA methyltransferase [Acidobacteria bacterium]|nr:TrmH family RNA methyltransferase [Acidobacteriota bacterium]
MEAVPFRVLQAATPYESLRKLPAVAALDNIRSLHNVGAFFRTADAAGLESLLLGGYTGAPPHPGVAKVALGAQDSLPWKHAGDLAAELSARRESGWQIAGVETVATSVDLYDWVPQFPLCVVFGNEVEGLSETVKEACDVYVRIPMLGVKQSLNVSVAGGVVLFELLRKYRRMLEAAAGRRPA